jgi:hypothetical protein
MPVVVIGTEIFKNFTCHMEIEAGNALELTQLFDRYSLTFLPLPLPHLSSSPKSEKVCGSPSVFLFL